MISTEVQLALDYIVDISKKISIRPNFHGLNLSRAKLDGAQFPSSSFAFSDLSEAQLTRGLYKDSDFYCSNLFRANLSSSNFEGTSLKEDEPKSNFAGALLYGAYIANASFQGSNLVRAILDQASVVDSDFSRANLFNAMLFGTTFTKVNFDQTITDSACFVGAKIGAGTDLGRSVGMNPPIVAEAIDALSGESPCRAHLLRPGPRPVLP
jgi:uncharacterized protein YjbI with pentapeptide repeats